MIESTPKLDAVAPSPVGGAPATPPVQASGATSDKAAASSPPAPAAAAQPSTRLLVEPDGGHGFLYRLVDAATGRTLLELPRDQAAQLQSDPGYSAGALVSRSV